MWQNRLNGVLGLWVVALAFLDFSVTLHVFLLVITGLAITLVAFWGNHLVKPTKDLVKESREASKRLKELNVLKPVLNISNTEDDGGDKVQENEKPFDGTQGKPEIKKIVANIDESEDDKDDQKSYPG